MRVSDGRTREHENVVGEIDHGGAGGHDIAVGRRVEKRFEDNDILAPLHTHRSAVHLVMLGHRRDNGFDDHVKVQCLQPHGGASRHRSPLPPSRSSQPDVVAFGLVGRREITPR